MIVVGFVSSYCEGRLVRGAIDSLLEVELDALYVFEGPAGPALVDRPPASDIREAELERRVERLVVHHGRWRTDGRKRNDWLQRVKRDYHGYDDGIIWAVVVDADEVLVNGRFLRDRLEYLVARDEQAGASITTPDNPPMARWPLHLVEHEGSMSIITGRVFRVDLLQSIDHSSSVVTNVAGVRDGWGNFAEQSAVWIERWLHAIDNGAMIAWPPLPAEPYLVHRSNLRHPLRAGLRMSQQEQAEFAKAQQSELAGADHIERMH